MQRVRTWRTSPLDTRFNRTGQGRGREDQPQPSKPPRSQSFLRFACDLQSRADYAAMERQGPRSKACHRLDGTDHRFKSMVADTLPSVSTNPRVHEFTIHKVEPGDCLETVLLPTFGRSKTLFSIKSRTSWAGLNRYLLMIRDALEAKASPRIPPPTLVSPSRQTFFGGGTNEL